MQCLGDYLHSVLGRLEVITSALVHLTLLTVLPS
jgi:hypothetical protein